MKKLSNIFLLLMGIMLTSCMSTKKVTYFQNLDNVDLSKTTGLYDAKIMPKDILSITVHTLTPKASEAFNLKGTTGAGLAGYLVDNEGNIDFPVVGILSLGGMTTREAETLIKSKIVPYMSASENPIVQVRMSNYKYAMLGAVNGPGVYTAPNEKISIVEAIARAGDLNLYGQRDKIFLIRENEHGEREYHQLNINDAEIFNSPYYYLQQNDIVYVEPKKVEARNAFFNSSTSMWVSLFGMLTSVSTFILALTR